MERNTELSISNGTNQILGQYTAREIIDDDTVDEICQRITGMLDRSWEHGDIIGYNIPTVETTPYAISASVKYVINSGDNQIEQCYLVLRMTPEKRAELLERIHALEIEVNSIVPAMKQEEAFDRAMNGVGQ